MSFLNWLKPSIDRGIKRGVDAAVSEFFSSGALDKKIMEIARNDPHFMFIKQMQARFLDRAPELGGKASFELSRGILNDFLRDSRIGFGDPAFDWSRAGADTLADEEMHHWETRP